jgi:hypothetical protein
LRRRTRTEKRWVMSPRNRKAFMAAAVGGAAIRAWEVRFRTTSIPDAQGNGEGGGDGGGDHATDGKRGRDVREEPCGPVYTDSARRGPHVSVGGGGTEESHRRGREEGRLSFDFVGH